MRDWPSIRRAATCGDAGDQLAGQLVDALAAADEVPNLIDLAGAGRPWSVALRDMDAAAIIATGLMGIRRSREAATMLAIVGSAGRPGHAALAVTQRVAAALAAHTIS